MIETDALSDGLLFELLERRHVWSTWERFGDGRQFRCTGGREFGLFVSELRPGIRNTMHQPPVHDATRPFEVGSKESEEKNLSVMSRDFGTLASRAFNGTAFGKTIKA